MRAWPAVVVLMACVQSGNGTGQSQQRLDPCMNGDPSCMQDPNSDGTKDPTGQNGPDDPCAQLSPDECALKAPFCEVVSDCPKCDPSTNQQMCPERPCTIVGCRLAVPPDRCAGLSEQACNETSGCQGRYETACTNTDPMNGSTGMQPDKTDNSTGQNCVRLFAGCNADTVCGQKDSTDQPKQP